MNAHMHMGAFGRPERVSYYLELELHVAVSCQTWVLGAGCRSFARAARDLKC